MSTLTQAADLPERCPEASRELRYYLTILASRNQRTISAALEGIETARAKRRHAEQAKQNQPQTKKSTAEKSQKWELVPTSEKKENERARDTVGKKVTRLGFLRFRNRFLNRNFFRLSLAILPGKMGCLLSPLRARFLNTFQRGGA